MRLVETIKVGNILGEGVVWDHRSQSALWTDIEARVLYRLEWPGGVLKKIDLPERLCSFALTEDPVVLLAAFDRGFAYLDLRSTGVSWLDCPSDVSPGSGRRLNDGRTDPMGRFWCGAMVEDRAAAAGERGKLYRFQAGVVAEAMRSDISISNGICWSPCGNCLYFTDTPTRKILKYDYCLEAGNISNPRIFATTPEGAFPDGAVTDAEGNLWSAHWGAGQVVCYDLEGNIKQVLDVPAIQPSCVAFGGRKNNLLFVTSAKKDMTAMQLAQDANAGNLFVFETSVTGVPEPLFEVGR